MARIIFNLPKDMASDDVLDRAGWFTIRFDYKLAIFNACIRLITEGCPSKLINCIAKKQDLSTRLFTGATF